MPVMDEFKEQREAMKKASFREKLKYFWYYYKFHTIGGIAVIVFAALLINSIVSQKDNAFFAALLNSAIRDEAVANELCLNYAEYAGIDTKEYDIVFDNSFSLNQSSLNEITVSSYQRIMVYTAAAELDVIMGGSDVFPEQAYQSKFCDLRDILSKEQLAEYEPYFYYVDRAVIAERERIAETADTDTVYPEYPDPTKPESMEDPIPVALFATDCDKLTNAFLFGGDYSAVGVLVNAPCPDNAIKFIDYIFE